MKRGRVDWNSGSEEGHFMESKSRFVGMVSLSLEVVSVQQINRLEGDVSHLRGLLSG